MKTAEEWFQLLPDDIREKAGYIKPEHNKIKCHSLDEAITRSINWGTYQSKGWKFWRKLRDDIRNGKTAFGTDEYQIF